MKNLNANFPDLKIELMTEDESDGLILLQQSNDENVDRVPKTQANESAGGTQSPSGEVVDSRQLSMAI